MPEVKDRKKIENTLAKEYSAGFVTKVESETFEPGINEDIVTRLSKIKNEPQWLLDYRLKSYRRWLEMKQPNWSTLNIDPIDYQSISYYSAPKKGPASYDEVDPEIKKDFEKLGIPLAERAKLAGVAVDAVFDSVSVATTYQKELADKGIIFCSFSEAVHNHPELVKKYLGSVIPRSDNYFATLNSAVFSDGTFVYIPKNTKCPMELSTYFRINASNTGQFERTLIVADEGSSVSYLEGCTAPMRDENQLHAANVELVAMKDAEIKYSTIQNWYPGDPETGKGGIYNFVTKRGLCKGENSRITWTQFETGSRLTWKYPSCILKGDNSVGEFYSVALTNGHQQADTGTKMIHIGKNTKSTIISKGISAGKSTNTYRGLVQVGKRATGAKNFTACDSLMMGSECSAITIPYIDSKTRKSTCNHEATTSKIDEDQLFYMRCRGIPEEDATNLLVSGFCKEVFQKLPMEFAVEANKLLEVSMEGSVG
jgi:Fe-S cluster assembly protein SufB